VHALRPITKVDILSLVCTASDSLRCQSCHQEQLCNALVKAIAIGVEQAHVVAVQESHEHLACGRAKHVCEMLRVIKAHQVIIIRADAQGWHGRLCFCLPFENRIRLPRPLHTSSSTANC